MSPPGLAPVAGARWNHKQREGSIGQPCLDAEALVRVARSSPAIAALNIGQSQLSRIVRGYIATHVERPVLSSLDDCMDSPDDCYALIGWVLSYADPTAKEAVRNVDRERGW